MLSQAMQGVFNGLQLRQVLKQRSVSVYTEQVAGVGLAHACIPAVLHALNLGRVYDTLLLKVFQSAKQWRSLATKRSTIGCNQVALPNQRAVTDRRASAHGVHRNSRGQVVERTLSALINLS